jgi:hypothetical protein
MHQKDGKHHSAFLHRRRQHYQQRHMHQFLKRQAEASASEQASTTSALALATIMPAVAAVANKPMYRSTVTTGVRETELPSDLLDRKNIRHYAASIF